MPHVDEGTLHAYLDGALDAVLPAGEAAEVRRHLLVCAACMERLEAERALRDGASTLLGLAAPPVVAPPPFEDVRARAREPRGPETRNGGARRRLWSLGWAASLVLAAGAGWLLRGARVPVVVQERAGAAAAPPATAEAASPPATTAVAASPPATTAVADEAVTTTAVADEAVAAPSVPAPSPEEPAAPPSSGKARPVLPDPVSAQRAASPSPVPVEPALRPRAVTREARTLLLPDAPSAGAGGGAGRDMAPVRLDTVAFPASLPEAKLAVAALGTPAADAGGLAVAGLAVPGLEVLSVQDLTGLGIAGGERVLQLVAPGDTLELVRLPAGVEPSALPPLREGRTELVVPRDGGWLVARAAGDRERLRDWVRLLEGGR